MAALHEIQTIVILMLENRSFDHMLGHLLQEGLMPEVEGLSNPLKRSYENFLDGEVFSPFLIEDEEKLILRDPPHDRRRVQMQLARNSRGSRFTMSGFVKAYVDSTQDRVKDSPPMGYFNSNGAWMTSFLARQYCVCDHWFTPLPADTQPNRSMAFTGLTLIDETRSDLIPHRDHVFGWLTNKDIRWRVYYDGPPFFLLFGRFDELVGDKYQPIDELAHDIQTEARDRAPQVIFIEPRYFDFFWSDKIPNCNHPPARICNGELLLHRVYTALTSNPEKWAHTLLIITYDEHGGFFDHVQPLRIKSPAPPGAKFTQGFETTGPRVPGLLISPWVKPGKVFKGNLDHTSMLQLLAEKFGSGPESYSAPVTDRRTQVEGIRSLSEALADSPAVRPIPTQPPRSCPTMPPTKRKPQLPNERAFQKAALQLLEKEGPMQVTKKYPDMAGAPLTES